MLHHRRDVKLYLVGASASRKSFTDVVGTDLSLGIIKLFSSLSFR
jgi:hypothetical protein